jgi:hypothetical protein
MPGSLPGSRHPDGATRAKNAVRHLPQKRQDIRPPAGVVPLLIAVVVVMLVAAVVISIAAR